MTKTQAAVIAWLANKPHASKCSRTLAFYLGFGVLPKDGELYHPGGIGSFCECVEVLKAAPALRAKLPETASLSRQWKRLVSAWEQIEETYTAEQDLCNWRRPAEGSAHALVKAFLDGKRPRRRPLTLVHP
jgi:hypothetical protein